MLLDLLPLLDDRGGTLLLHDPFRPPTRRRTSTVRVPIVAKATRPTVVAAGPPIVVPVSVTTSRLTVAARAAITIAVSGRDLRLRPSDDEDLLLLVAAYLADDGPYRGGLAERRARVP